MKGNLLLVADDLSLQLLTQTSSSSEFFAQPDIGRVHGLHTSSLPSQQGTKIDRNCLGPILIILIS